MPKKLCALFLIWMFIALLMPQASGALSYDRAFIDHVGDVNKYSSVNSLVGLNVQGKEYLDIASVESFEAGENITIVLTLVANAEIRQDSLIMYNIIIYTSQDNSTGYNVAYSFGFCVVIDFENKINVDLSNAVNLSSNNNSISVDLPKTTFFSNATCFGLDAYAMEDDGAFFYLDHVNELPMAEQGDWGWVAGYIVNDEGSPIESSEIRDMGGNVVSQVEVNGSFMFKIVPGYHEFEVWYDTPIGWRKLAEFNATVIKGQTSDVGNIVASGRPNWTKLGDDGTGQYLIAGIIAGAAGAVLAVWVIKKKRKGMKAESDKALAEDPGQSELDEMKREALDDDSSPE